MLTRRAALLCSLSTLAVLAGVLGCGSQVQVRTAFDKSKDFASYRTFAMLEPNKPIRSDDPDVDPFVLQRLRQITYSRLLRRGFQPVSREQADVLVHVLAGVKERVELNSTSYYGYAWRGPAFGYTYDQYQEGTVIVDLIDRKANAVIWRGAGVRRVVGTPTNAVLAEVIERILSYYPPGAQPE